MAAEHFRRETGGEVGGFDYFITGNYFDEDGWRDLSPTRVYQGFGRSVGRTTRPTSISSYTYADTRLIGNGAVPQSLLDLRREAIYSAPDLTHNLLHFVNLNGTHFLTDSLLLSGNVYHRRLVTVRQQWRCQRRQLSVRGLSGSRDRLLGRAGVVGRQCVLLQRDQSCLAPDAEHHGSRPATDSLARSLRGNESGGRGRQLWIDSTDD